jgi:hypothetical protein
MQITQSHWSPDGGWDGGPPAGPNQAQVLLLFAGASLLGDSRWRADVQRAFPQALLFGCTTAGEICGTRVYDDTLCCTAIQFGSTTVALERTRIEHPDESFAAGHRLAAALVRPGLTHVFVLSDGHRVNGSQLVRGMTEALPAGVQVTGGLAGDGARFEHTLVLAGDELAEGTIGALGMYGDRLRVGFGSLGGWDPFGPERRVTRSQDNVVYELDGKPALALYKTYLGEHAAGLPATGLLFPLSIRDEGQRGESLVRTILSVDEAAQSLTFAGDVPQGALAQLMKANFERLIDGAAGAARTSQTSLRGSAPELAILISCVGRKLVLKQRTEEEVEEVRYILGDRPVLTGFYSYGEISPAAPDASCELHNQTMTITTFAEV